GFDLAARPASGGTVVAGVSAAPGWRCAVGGRESGLLTVNSAFLGFPVPPGAHRVRLDYRPASWRWGLLLGGLGICAVAITLLKKNLLTSRRFPFIVPLP